MIRFSSYATALLLGAYFYTTAPSLFASYPQGDDCNKSGLISGEEYFDMALINFAKQGPSEDIPEDELGENFFTINKKAVEQNCPIAQSKLAWMHLQGEYHTQHISKEERHIIAFELYKKAAEQNNDTAQSNLALMYFDGQATQKNWKKALDLYNKSKENGNRESFIDDKISLLTKFFDILRSKDLLINAMAEMLPDHLFPGLCNDYGIGGHAIINHKKAFIAHTKSHVYQDGLLQKIKDIFLSSLHKQEEVINDGLYVTVCKYISLVNERLSSYHGNILDPEDLSQQDVLFEFFTETGLLSAEESCLYREELYPSE